MSVFDTTNKILAVWEEVRGIDTSETASYRGEWTWSLDGSIEHALDVDPTGLTGYMVVRSNIRSWLGGIDLDALALLERRESMMSYIGELTRLYYLLDDEDAKHLVQSFQDDLRAAADHYDLREALEPVISDLARLGHLRMNALHAAKTLHQHTFSIGEGGTDDLTYNQRVVKFWNIQSVLKACRLHPENGLSLCLVRDPRDVAYSFFSIIHRDGDRLLLWNDRGRPPMPVGGLARPAMVLRQFERRADRYLFPYQLLDIRYDDEEDPRAILENDSTQLVPVNAEATPIAEIKDLPPDQILWLFMVFDLLRARVAKEDFNQTLSILTKEYQPTLQEAPSSDEAGIPAKVVTDCNYWMIERYGHLVDPRLFDVRQTTKVLHADPLGRPRVSTILDLDLENTEDLLPQREDWEPQIRGLDVSLFGTPEEVAHDHAWVARWNFAQALQTYALEEYDRRKREIRDWFQERVFANQDVLMQAIGRGSWALFEKDDPDHTQWILSPRDGIRVHPSSPPWRDFYHIEHPVLQMWHRNPKDPRGSAPSKYPYLCWVREQKASVWAFFEPRTPQEIAALMGIPEEELPPFLQNWRDERYHTNSLLYRTDPVNTAIRNPWNHIGFQVLVGLCKREHYKLQKKYGG